MKTFLTEKDGFEGPEIEAIDFQQAEQKALELNVEITGEHILTIYRKGLTDSDADRICKALSESYDF